MASHYHLNLAVGVRGCRFDRRLLGSIAVVGELHRQMLPPGSWQRVQSLFDRADALSDAERERFLDMECAGDPDLRAEVVSLLRNAQGADTAMRVTVSAAVESLSISSAAAAIGTRLRPYRPGPLLAGGGMGLR